MRAFTRHEGLVVPLDYANVDTDAIIPKQFLKSIKRTGFGPNLFDSWRYLDHGEPGMDCSQRPLNAEFPLNQLRYLGASILLAGENFGCGSSREHAVWALDDFGIRAVVAPGFADIFFNNCTKNGVLPVRLAPEAVTVLFEAVAARPGYTLCIDLPAQTVTAPDGTVFRFELDPFQKHCLVEGLDDIALTLQHGDEIRTYESRRRREAPWLFPGAGR